MCVGVRIVIFLFFWIVSWSDDGNNDFIEWKIVLSRLVRNSNCLKSLFRSSLERKHAPENETARQHAYQHIVLPPSLSLLFPLPLLYLSSLISLTLYFPLPLLSPPLFFLCLSSLLLVTCGSWVRKEEIVSQPSSGIPIQPRQWNGKYWKIKFQ